MKEDATKSSTAIISSSSASSRNQLATDTRNEIGNQLRDVARLIVVDERGMVDIMRGQMSSFYELLVIKLRMQYMRYNQALEMLSLSSNSASNGDKNSLTGSSSSFVTSTLGSLLEISASSSFSSFSGSTSKLVIKVLIAFFLVSKVGVKGLVVVAAYFGITNIVQRVVTSSERAQCANFVRAFNGEQVSPISSAIGGSKSTATDVDVQVERIIQDLCQGLALRHLYQIVRLSKHSHAILAEIIVSRITRCLTRYPETFQNESRNPSVAAFQHFISDLQLKFDMLVKPGDMIKLPKRMPLFQRCIHAITAEFEESDHKILELEPLYSRSKMIPPEIAHYFETDEDKNEKPQASIWLASELLSRCGIIASDNSEEKAKKYWLHPSLSLPIKYGFCSGTTLEALSRGMIQVINLKREREAENSPSQGVEPSKEPKVAPVSTKPKMGDPQSRL